MVGMQFLNTWRDLSPKSGSDGSPLKVTLRNCILPATVSHVATLHWQG